HLEPRDEAGLEARSLDVQREAVRAAIASVPVRQLDAVAPLQESLRRLAERTVLGARRGALLDLDVGDWQLGEALPLDHAQLEAARIDHVQDDVARVGGNRAVREVTAPATLDLDRLERERRERERAAGVRDRRAEQEVGPDLPSRQPKRGLRHRLAARI